MPAKYVRIRDSLMRKGMSRKASQRKAAMIYNYQRKSGEAPVTGKHKGKK